MPTYFELEVLLDGVEPRVWRTFLLRSDLTFHELHDTIQGACGWEDRHLYQFMDGRTRKRICEAPFENEYPGSHEVELTSVFLRVGDSCIYEYDFGDSWWHVVKLKKISELKGQFQRKLTGGERSFPPEDCGGVPGYERCIAAIGISKTELASLDDDDEEMLSRREWMGDWDPEEFDFDATARQLRLAVHPAEF